MKNEGGWAGIVGMPDKTDKENIMSLIRVYEKIHPGQINWLVSEEKREEKENAGLGGVDKFLVKNKQSDMRKVLVIPAPLLQELEKSYPTLFKDKNHFRWFVKNFPMFMVAEKY